MIYVEKILHNKEMSKHCDVKKLIADTRAGRWWEQSEHKDKSDQKWKTLQEGWVRKNEYAHPQENEKKRLDEFNELKMAFFALYTYSFSVDNFPPLRERRSDH